MGHDSKVVRSAGLGWEKVAHGQHFAWRRKRLAAAAGGTRLGLSLYELPPGRRSFPYHYHCANEEGIYVLEGKGAVRLARRTVRIGAGDYVALPVGPGGAHQVLNTSRRPLRYLCFSTLRAPEICVYLDSGKLGLFDGLAQHRGRGNLRRFRFVRPGPDLDYWDGEDGSGRART